MQQGRMKRGFTNLSGMRRSSRSSRSDAPSGSSSRRHSVSESPQRMEVDEPAPRNDMLLLGGMQDMRSASMRFTEPRERTGAPPVPPRLSTRSTASPPYVLKLSEFGFMIMSQEEEYKLNSLKGRLMENSAFDDDTLIKLGFHTDIYKLLDNLGWRKFSIGISVDHREDLAYEMLMTIKTEMRAINENGDEALFLSFRIKNQRRWISYESIGGMLGFNTKAPKYVEVEEDELENFWENIAAYKDRMRRSVCNIVLQIFHSWMTNRILGRMKEGKIMESELNWMYAALGKKQKIDPTYTMIDKWLREAESGS